MSKLEILQKNWLITYKALYQRYFGGTPQIFWSFMSPYLPLFIAFLLTNFRKFSKFGVLCPAIFFEKFPENFLKFSQLFQNRKRNFYFYTKIVHNHYINQNFAKFSLKTPKKSRFFPKNPKFFKIFGAFGAENLEFYVPKILNFLEKESPPWAGGPPQISLLCTKLILKDCYLRKNLV